MSNESRWWDIREYIFVTFNHLHEFVLFCSFCYKNVNHCYTFAEVHADVEQRFFTIVLHWKLTCEMVEVWWGGEPMI